MYEALQENTPESHHWDYQWEKLSSVTQSSSNKINNLLKYVFFLIKLQKLKLILDCS